MDSYNNEKYRVCLDEYHDEDGECYGYLIELATTDGEGGQGFGVETLKAAKVSFSGDDLDNNWGIENVELKYFNDLEEAKSTFNSLCEDYAIE
tara:strand:- start:279 stop:557 length:279 start_codon:yes stop_codon:yes gene_type:complete